MVTNEPSQSTLLILGRTHEIIPLSTAALSVAQFVGSIRNETQLRERLDGALIVYRDGNVARIEQVSVVGLPGNTLREKIGNILMRVKRIRVHLSPVGDMTFGDIKNLVMRCVELDRSNAEPYLPSHKPLPQMQDELRACITCEAIFDVLQVPEPHDCLDTL